MPKTSPGQMSIFDIDVPATKAKLTEANPDVENQMDQGYCPGHPWYYKLGGRVLGVDEIRPAEFHNFDPIYRTKSGKPRPALKIQLESAKQQLEKDIARYKQLITEGDKACSSYDLSMGYDAKFNLSLAHNHISYHKGLICKIETAINRFDL